MTNIKKQAGSYGGYPTDDQSLRPLTIALISIVVVWSIVYLLGCATNRLDAQKDDPLGKPPLALSLMGP